MVTKMNHQVYLPDDVWGEVKEFLIPPRKPEQPHPIAQELRFILFTEIESHPRYRTRHPLFRLWVLNGLHANEYGCRRTRAHFYAC